MVVEMMKVGYVFIVVFIVVYFRVCRFYIAAAVCRSLLSMQPHVSQNLKI